METSYLKKGDWINGGDMRYPEGGENKGRKTISGQRKKNILLRCLGEYKIPRGSISKIGMKINKRKMIGKHQTSFRRSHRWCFAT